MKRMILIASCSIISACFLTSCIPPSADYPSYLDRENEIERNLILHKNKMSEWVDYSINDAIAAFGKPKQQMPTVYIWENSEDTYVPGYLYIEREKVEITDSTGKLIGRSEVPIERKLESYIKTDWCKTIFYTNTSGIIVKTDAEGNNCKYRTLPDPEILKTINKDEAIIISTCPGGWYSHNINYNLVMHKIDGNIILIGDNQSKGLSEEKFAEKISVMLDGETPQKIDKGIFIFTTKAYYNTIIEATVFTSKDMAICIASNNYNEHTFNVVKSLNSKDKKAMALIKQIQKYFLRMQNSRKM